ncbi:unnamed protein product [Anisakis simplex]|uniref:Mini-chromosome maintenance complex-binding protein n=1 Tax=Anisakis simplex TaxID=6269 RepID=A0A0M3K9Y8_ANISI|nr:unnamed protein product [Anisakis simplex]
MTAQLRIIRWPVEDAREKYLFYKELVNVESANARVDDVSYSDVVATLFNNLYRQLYVFRKNHITEMNECVTFHVNISSANATNDQLNFIQIGKFNIHQNNNQRTLWTQDPYTLKMFYAQEETIDSELMEIYSFDFEDLMSILIDGANGKLERVVIGMRHYLSVSMNVAISYSAQYGKIKQYVHRLNETSKVILCEQSAHRSRLDPAVQLMVLFDEDYCKVRDGSSSVQNCNEHENELVVEGSGENIKMNATKDDDSGIDESDKLVISKSDELFDQ